MDPEVTLVPLDCPSCGAAIAADGEDVVYYCTACRNGYRYEPSHGLRPVDVAFLALAARTSDVYRPFWLLPARITIHERQATGSGFSGLLGFFFGTGERRATHRDGTFAVPAFQASLAAVMELARRYTEALPELSERLAERLAGGCYGVEDARRLAHYLLVAGEAGQPDTLKQLRYDIEFREPRLLGVPFVRHGEGWRDAIFGISTAETDRVR